MRCCARRVGLRGREVTCMNFLATSPSGQGVCASYGLKRLSSHTFPPAGRCVRLASARLDAAGAATLTDLRLEAIIGVRPGSNNSCVQGSRNMLKTTIGRFRGSRRRER